MIYVSANFSTVLVHPSNLNVDLFQFQFDHDSCFTLKTIDLSDTAQKNL